MLNGKVKKYFIISGGNSGLTEEYIYQNQPLNLNDGLNVYSGATQLREVTGIVKKDSVLPNNKRIKSYTGESIRIVRKGKAGSMFWVSDNNFTINDDAYVMQVRDEYKNYINLKYVLYTQRNEVQNCVSSDGKGKNGTFNKTLYEESFINLPSIEKQNEIVYEYEKIFTLRENLIDIVEKINQVISKNPQYMHGEEVYIDDVFELLSEDRRLTEEYIYNHQGAYPVYSAQIEGAYGYIDEYKYDRHILFVVQYGTAGKTVLRSGKMNIGRNVCGLIPKKDYENKIDLRFAKYALEKVFVDNSKGTDLKSLSHDTIRTTRFFLPDYATQVLIAKEYEKLENIKIILQKYIEELNNMLK